MCKDYSAREVCKSILSSRRAELEQAIRQLAVAVGNKALDEETVRLFFQEVLDNSWDAYEEATCNKSHELRELNKQVLDLENRIVNLIGKRNKSLMDQYATLVNCRDRHELEEAYLTGYQCALRFVLMGIMPAPVLMQGYWDREEQDGDRA
ncbi:MAG: hypothetical protein IJN31_00490 [Peptococcaceae bacterium]|nr:hypothetical protein [Peptococcaceae bacterium]